MSNVLAEIAGKLLTLLGYDGTDFRNVHVDEAGDLQVNVGGDALGELEDISGLLLATHDDMRLTSSAPFVFNLDLTLINTEYSQALPNGTHQFLVRCRGAYDLKMAFVEDESGVTYITIPSGYVYWEYDLTLAGFTVYLQCPTAGQVAEILIWA